MSSLAADSTLLLTHQKLGATFEPGKGGHLNVTLNGRRSILPMHGNKELKTGTWLAIQKQLGLKEND